MVRKTLYLLLIVLLTIPFFCAFSQSSSQSGSFNELVIGSPPDSVGEHIAKRGGWRLNVVKSRGTEKKCLKTFL